MNFTPKREYELSGDEALEMTTGERFIKIWDFMLGYFKLEKTELLVYAIIFTMHRNYCAYFTGSREYLATWTNSTTRTVSTALKSLEERDLIRKYYRQCGQIKRAIYYVNVEALPTCNMFSLENRNRDNLRKMRGFDQGKN